MSEKLRFFDPQLKEKPEKELFDEPEWLIHLRQLDGQIKVMKTKKVCVCMNIADLYLFASVCLCAGSQLLPFFFLSGSN